ncbi:MAG: 30S ribosomal protein S1 [Actinomycetota bacterium]
MAEKEKEENKQEPEQLEEGFLRNAETGKIEPDYEGTIKEFGDGDIVTGTVVRVDRDEVLVDIGYKSEGVIPARELSIRYGVSPEDVVKIGDTIDALVLQKEDKDGRLILSKKRAEYERVWQRLDAIKEIDGTVKGQVIEVVKGGLIVDIGLRGFVPASLVDTMRVKDLKAYMGQEFECKIVELNRNRNNVVLSRRAFLDTLRKEEKKQLLDHLEKGQVVKGTVSSVVSFGAFVDIGGLDGLVHISELSWGHVDHPSEVLAVGDEVTVQILDVDKERNRVSLGLKQCQPDPWKETVKKFKTGEIVEGTITNLVPFGAFVSVADGVEGLIHISELADQRVEFPGDVVEAGQTVTVKIVDIEIDRHRLSLSLKQALSPEEREAAAEKMAESSAVEVEEDKEAPAEEVPAVEEEKPTEPEEKPAEPEELPQPASRVAARDLTEEAPAEEAPVEEIPAAEEKPVEEEASQPGAKAAAKELTEPEPEPAVETKPEPEEKPEPEPVPEPIDMSATEAALRDIEAVDREVEPIDATSLTSPDLMAEKKSEPPAEAPQPASREESRELTEPEPAKEAPPAEKVEEAKEEPSKPAPEPDTLEAILEDMKKESKSPE